MKRCIICFLIFLLLSAAILSRNAMTPGRFTGIWYAAGTGKPYDFREGIIRKDEDDIPDGAYAFTRDTITLFVTGQGDIRTLYWVSKSWGDVLSTDPKGEQAMFCRNPQ